MTDRPDDPRADDQAQHLPDVDAATELTSALHDGEAGEDERARAGDPAVADELAQVAAVSALVADVPPPPAGLVDDHVAAALAAFDAPVADEQPDGAPVVALADRRAWWARAPLGAVAAAIAVVALVGAIGFAAVGDDGGSDDTATAALEEGDGAEGADALSDDAAGEAETFEADAGGGAATGLTAAEREAYGSYDELAAALRERADVAVPEASDEDVASSPSSADDTIAAAPPDEEQRSAAAGCDAIGAAEIDPGQVRLVASVLVADRLVTAVVHDTDGERRLTAVDEETCAVVEQRTL